MIRIMFGIVIGLFVSEYHDFSFTDLLSYIENIIKINNEDI